MLQSLPPVAPEIQPNLGASMLPPLNLDFGSSAASRLGMEGASWGGFGAGDWNVNVAGSGVALQSASSLSPWLLAAAAAAAYFIFKK